MKKVAICAKCGARMRTGIKLCTKCGYRLVSDEAMAMAEAAQAAEAEANMLSEEEIAALTAVTEAASEIPAADVAPEEDAAEATEEAVSEEAVAACEDPSADSTDDVAAPEADATADAVVAADVATETVAEPTKAVRKLHSSTEKEVARLAATADARVARVEGRSAVRRQATENASRVEAARLDHAAAEAESRASKKSAASASRISAMEIAENERLARLRAAEDKKNFRANAAIASRDAARAARDERQSIKNRAFEGRVADMKQDADHALEKRKERETLRSERVEISERERAFREEAKNLRARTRALHAEDKKAARYRREEENSVVRERSSENKLHERRVTMEKAKLKHRAGADAKMQELRLADELKTQKRLAADREKATRLLLREEGRISDRGNDELKKNAEEKAFDNRLYAKQAAAEKRTRKRRQSDLQRIAAKQAAVRERETKRLGSLEYRAASVNLSVEAAEARRQADATEREMQRRREEEKLTAREALAEKKLIRQRAADKQKHSRTKTAMRAKETRALGRAEMRALRVTSSEEAKETRRRTDEVNLQIDQKMHEDKLYAKKLAAERRMIKIKAGDDSRLQQEDIRNQEMLREAQMLEESRTSRMRTDDTKRAVRDQKKQDELYQRRKTADDRISEREHKLELRRVAAEGARDSRVMAQKEREQKKNLRLAERYEKDAVKRAKKIAKISGVPVSLVPALSGDAAPSALLGDGGAAGGVPALHDPTALVSSSYETNREQYLAYKKKKKKEASRLRYAEINVRTDRKYFNAIYEDGEVLVAKRTVRISRVQAILALVLMLAALVTSFLPLISVPADSFVPVEIYNAVLDGQGIISFESLLTDGQGTQEDILSYMKGLLEKFTGSGIMDSVSNGILSYKDAFAQMLENETLFSSLGGVVLFVFLAIAILLTPVLILLNFIVALIRTICRFLGKGVGITRVMTNLRASYALLGFVVLPALAVADITLLAGFLIFVGVFAAVVVLNLVLNLFKKHEPCDRKLLRVVRLGGLIRLVLVGGFFYLVGSSNAFVISISTASTKGMVALACLVLGCVFLALCSRVVTALGFEVVGYARGKSLSHVAFVVFGLLGVALIIVPRFLVGAEIGDMIFVSAVLLLVFLAITLVMGLVRQIIKKKYNLIDPIVDALLEGYPLK